MNYIKTIKAEEAYEESIAKLREYSIEEEFATVMEAIECNTIRGAFAVSTPTMDWPKAELLAIELEESGCACQASSANELKDGVPQAYVTVNWKFLAQKSPQPYNSSYHEY